ncbi:MAG: PEP-CTERM sorting domain-containing protein [Crocosphaera sp.]|nr:PEP-CTERM sorting domain-containing protein [Crocosphaera sp.]
MNKLNLLSKLAIFGIVGGIGGIGFQTNAQAGMFVDQGYSIFASPDPGDFGVDEPNVLPNNPPDFASLQCPFCDSTVSFAVYQPSTNNWVTELELNPSLVANNPDLDAPYVFFYQVVNTDPLTVFEEPLRLFAVAEEEKIGNVGIPWNGPSLYSSAGWIADTVFGDPDLITIPESPPHTASTDINDNFGAIPEPPGGSRKDNGTGCISGVPGCPGNWMPDVLDSDFKGFIFYSGAVEPTEVNYGIVQHNEVERQGGPSPTNGYTWLWNTNPIPTIDDDSDGQQGPGERGTSSLLYLTAHTEEEFNVKAVEAGLIDPVCETNPNHTNCLWLKVNYPWAKTQGITGFLPDEGTSGDVAGLKVTKKTPEPGTILGLLAVGGLGLGLKRKKQS